MLYIPILSCLCRIFTADDDHDDDQFSGSWPYVEGLV